MISIRQLLFGVFVVSLASGAVVATTSRAWLFHYPAAIFALFFLGYVALVGIMAVYSEAQDRPFWIGCLITVLVLFVGSAFSPVSMAFSIYEEIAKIIDLTATDHLTAAEVRENAHRCSIIIRLCITIILSLAGGAFAAWASRRIQLTPN